MSGGAKNLFDRPARDPIPSCLKFPPWGGLMALSDVIPPFRFNPAMQQNVLLHR